MFRVKSSNWGGISGYVEFVRMIKWDMRRYGMIHAISISINEYINIWMSVSVDETYWLEYQPLYNSTVNFEFVFIQMDLLKRQSNISFTLRSVKRQITRYIWHVIGWNIYSSLSIKMSEGISTLHRMSSLVHLMANHWSHSDRTVLPIKNSRGPLWSREKNHRSEAVMGPSYKH